MFVYRRVQIFRTDFFFGIEIFQLDCSLLGFVVLIVFFLQRGLDD